MELKEIKNLLRAQVMTEEVDLSMEVKMVTASDLMSDVLSLLGSGAHLITGLTNSQAVRTAQVAELCGIVFVKGKQPSEDTIRMAQERGIPVLATDFSMYEACGILFSHGLAGIKNMKTGDD